MYHDRTAWHCAFFVGKKYGCSKGYPQRNAAHMSSIALWEMLPIWISLAAQNISGGNSTHYQEQI
jgi:hypothetical protein